MSLRCAKSLLGVGSQFLRRGVTVNKGVSVCGTGNWGVSQRSLTRSMWLLCKQHNTGVPQATGWTKTCQCCGLHTQGDKALTEFLTTEINSEQSLEKKLPSINGFQLTKSGSSEVEFTCTNKDETLQVSFNINSTVSDVAAPEQAPAEGDDSAPQLLSRPPFLVRLTKGDKTLAFNLIFPEPMPEEVESEEPYEDAILIDNMTILDKGQEWKETDYVVMGVDMDGTMYDLLLDVLDERGITDNFLDELVEFSTTYEHKKYVDFLQQLKGFCVEK